ncbi:hypothetical protein OU798_03465 [Prolixibacteraceae bacterium Z1-6]|uniref:Uncharacterized protein n=1 Tax=Draconibacterium aestuarii TaxID=2998507 RepID=A0A9X3J4I5_9BACT|nr:hypothetical protein [Prolixibacteraceae bacterium Z1-6]
MCGVNGFEVDIKWNEGKLVMAKVKSLLGKKGILRYNDKDYQLNLAKGEELNLDNKYF